MILDLLCVYFSPQPLIRSRHKITSENPSFDIRVASSEFNPKNVETGLSILGMDPFVYEAQNLQQSWG